MFAESLLNQLRHLHRPHKRKELQRQQMRQCLKTAFSFNSPMLQI
jgi:hypothetical protein